MARQRNKKAYEASKLSMIEVGLELFRGQGFRSTGLNDILRVSGLPKGSFYHYFDSKESYGLAVAEEYHLRQMVFAKQVLQSSEAKNIDKLRTFFSTSLANFEHRDFKDGCLMCNLSVELGASNEAFSKMLKRQWKELSAEIAACLGVEERMELGMSGLTPQEAGDVLLNGWSGALSRMKAEQSSEPLDLFLRSMLNMKAVQ